MVPSDVAVKEAPTRADSEQIVNDFSIQVATVNGSGSQTANLVLLRSIFGMGIPVSGKNMFPSNIAGLPTWFTIRANKDGYVARKKEIDILVAMNPETAREDALSLKSNSVVVYDEPLNLSTLRDDLVFYPVPFDKLVTGVCREPKLRRLVRNMIYDGVLGQLLDIDRRGMEQALEKQLGRKPKAVAMNQEALDVGFQYAEQHFEEEHPYRVTPLDKTAGKILMDGNAGAAIGALMAGVTVVTWYPITPSSSLCESLIDYLQEYRIDKETGKATFAVVQAEDEIAAVGMAIGAGWAGARSMTSTSGPGVSLMSEFSGLAYYGEVPTVIFDVQRVGPSTGLPTRTAQGDVLATAFLTTSRSSSGFPSARRLMMSCPLSIGASRSADSSGTKSFRTRLMMATWPPIVESGLRVILRWAISAVCSCNCFWMSEASCCNTGLASKASGALSCTVALSQPRSASPSA